MFGKLLKATPIASRFNGVNSSSVQMNEVVRKVFSHKANAHAQQACVPLECAKTSKLVKVGLTTFRRGTPSVTVRPQSKQHPRHDTASFGMGLPCADHKIPLCAIFYPSEENVARKNSKSPSET